MMQLEDREINIHDEVFDPAVGYGKVVAVHRGAIFPIKVKFDGLDEPRLYTSRGSRANSALSPRSLFKGRPTYLPLEYQQ